MDKLRLVHVFFIANKYNFLKKIIGIFSFDPLYCYKKSYPM